MGLAEVWIILQMNANPNNELKIACEETETTTSGGCEQVGRLLDLLLMTTAKNITHSGTEVILGAVVSNGTTIWVITGSTVTPYNISTKRAGTAISLGFSSRGGAYANNMVWIINNNARKAYAYTVGTNGALTRASTTRDVSFPAENINGGTSDGTTLWFVSDSIRSLSESPFRRNVYAYKVSDSSADTAKNLAVTGNIHSIFYHSNYMWFVETNSRQAQGYNATTKARLATSLDLSLPSGFSYNGATQAGNTIYFAQYSSTSSSNILLAYDLTFSAGSPGTTTTTITAKVITKDIAKEWIGSVAGTPGPRGPPGPAGPQGPVGPSGTARGVPAGGTTNQVLTKTSNSDYATAWRTPSGGTGGGLTQSQVDARIERWAQGGYFKDRWQVLPIRGVEGKSNSLQFTYKANQWDIFHSLRGHYGQWRNRATG